MNNTNKVFYISFITFVLNLYSVNYVMIQTIDSWYKLPTLVLFGLISLLAFLFSLLMFLQMIEKYLRESEK